MNLCINFCILCELCEELRKVIFQGFVSSNEKFVIIAVKQLNKKRIGIILIKPIIRLNLNCYKFYI